MGPTSDFAEVIRSVHDLPWEPNDLERIASLPSDLQALTKRFAARVTQSGRDLSKIKRAVVYLANGYTFTAASGVILGESKTYSFSLFDTDCTPVVYHAGISADGLVRILNWIARQPPGSLKADEVRSGLSV